MVIKIKFRHLISGACLIKQNKNHNKRFEINCSSYLGICNPLGVELWGIVDEVLIMLKNEFTKTTIQTDNLKVIHFLIENKEDDLGITILQRVQ